MSSQLVPACNMCLLCLQVNGLSTITSADPATSVLTAETIPAANGVAGVAINLVVDSTAVPGNMLLLQQGSIPLFNVRNKPAVLSICKALNPPFFPRLLPLALSPFNKAACTLTLVVLLASTPWV